jgi:hypothetical protein
MTKEQDNGNWLRSALKFLGLEDVDMPLIGKTCKVEHNAGCHCKDINNADVCFERRYHPIVDRPYQKLITDKISSEWLTTLAKECEDYPDPAPTGGGKNVKYIILPEQRIQEFQDKLSTLDIDFSEDSLKFEKIITEMTNIIISTNDSLWNKEDKKKLTSIVASYGIDSLKSVLYVLCDGHGCGADYMDKCIGIIDAIYAKIYMK